MTALTPFPNWLNESYAHRQLSDWPDWLPAFSESDWRNLSLRGLPSPKEERFKYNDFSSLLSQTFIPASMLKKPVLCSASILYPDNFASSNKIYLLNGQIASLRETPEALAPGLIMCGLKEAMKHYPELVQAHWEAQVDSQLYPFATLNTALFEDGLFIYVPDHCEVHLPLHLFYLAQAKTQPWMAQVNNLMVLGESSSLHLVEEYRADQAASYFMSVQTQLYLKKGAKLYWDKIQNEQDNAIHLAHLFVKQEAYSEFRLTDFAKGALFARDDIHIQLLGPGASCDVAGLYRLSRANQQIDHHLDVKHQAPQTRSAMLYKGILEQASRAIFNGRVFVAQDSQQVSAYQANHHLLLSSLAEAYSKPELEIYADDVQCKHGATVGQLDPEILFYLRSRGITEAQAKQIAVRGFVEEMIKRVTNLDLYAHIERLII